jgi:hypothetical protein
VILVTMAGKVGAEAVRLLRQREVPVRVLVRDPEKAKLLADAGAELAAGDLDVPASIDQAMAGVDTVVLVSPGVPAQELNVVASAARAGVGYVVKASSNASADSPIARRLWQTEIEAGLAASEVPHTLLRSNAYMQNVLALAPAIGWPASPLRSTWRRSRTGRRGGRPGQRPRYVPASSRECTRGSGRSPRSGRLLPPRSASPRTREQAACSRCRRPRSPGRTYERPSARLPFRGECPARAGAARHLLVTACPPPGSRAPCAGRSPAFRAQQRSATAVTAAGVTGTRAGGSVCVMFVLDGDLDWPAGRLVRPW